MALTKIPAHLSSTPSISDSGSSTAITIDSSGNVSLAGNLSVTGSTTTADNLVSADKNITLNLRKSILKDCKVKLNINLDNIKEYNLLDIDYHIFTDALKHLESINLNERPDFFKFANKSLTSKFFKFSSAINQPLKYN